MRTFGNAVTSRAYRSRSVRRSQIKYGVSPPSWSSTCGCSPAGQYAGSLADRRRVATLSIKLPLIRSVAKRVGREAPGLNLAGDDRPRCGLVKPHVTPVCADGLPCGTGNWG